MVSKTFGNFMMIRSGRPLCSTTLPRCVYFKVKVGTTDALTVHAGFPLVLENGKIRKVFPDIEFEMFTRKSWKSEGKLY